MLSEKTQELDKLRSEWASHTASLANKHSQELTNEKEKALQVRMLKVPGKCHRFSYFINYKSNKCMH